LSPRSADPEQRDLQETQAAITTRCWTECVEQALTADQCMALIQAELGVNLQLHEIPNLQLKVHTPRDEFWFGLTYFQVGIPTDMYGNVACDKSVLRYEFSWEVDMQNGTTRELTLPDYDCVGMSAVECCSNYKSFLKSQNIPLVDHQGNCLSCWAHQEPIAPVLASDGTGDVMYIDHQYQPDTQTCEARSFTNDAVVAIDQATTTSLRDDVTEMETILADDIVTCAQLTTLFDRLLIHARGVNTAMNFVATFVCGYCDDSGSGSSFAPIPSGLSNKFQFIASQILKTTIQSNINYIIIYTDAFGNVIEPPKVGGDRADIDWNLYDPDCETDTGDDEIPPGTEEDERNGGESAFCDPNEITSDPVFGAQFSTSDVAFKCNTPTGTVLFDPDVYSMTLLHFDDTIQKGDSKRTRLTYRVCSSTGDLINKVVVPWKGHCTVTKYHYLDIEFDGCAYAAGKDDTTCVVGFTFDESWQSVAAYADPARTQICANFLLELDGWVDKTVNVGAVATEGGQYVLMDVEAPNCSGC
jgi:hypothetical protein